MYGLLKSGEVVRFVKSAEDGEFYVGVKEKLKEDQSNAIFVHNDNILEYDSNLIMLSMRAQQMKEVKYSNSYIITFYGFDHLVKRDIPESQNTFVLDALTVENVVKAYKASFLYQTNPELKRFNENEYVELSDYIYLNDIIKSVAENVIESYMSDPSSKYALVDITDNYDKNISITIQQAKSI